MTPVRYATAAAFKQALETRLRSASSSGTDFARRRQLLVFQRLLARITVEFGDAVTLKGGLVVELRVDRARTTKDVDLRLVGSPVDLLERLQRAAQLELGDFMRFEIVAHGEHPEIANEGMVYEGRRYRVACSVAGKPYGQPFGLDIGFADPIFGEPDVVQAEDVLGFAGIPPGSLRLYPLETHVAEKLHAYTLPRKRPNSRVKDLPDIALLASVREIALDDLQHALRQTFAARKTHELPRSLPSPPSAWVAPYARMAFDDELRWPDMPTLVRAVGDFLDPALSGAGAPIWRPSEWCWGVMVP
ncbi:MAG: nucleotidyl transferase AbiEii/AbiGii toxin family protein [Myxococcales bacterium]|nr:nucleotidyl transferase AbiEii/AbiGii toxin family protein [Myxococcales bacterium]